VLADSPFLVSFSLVLNPPSYWAFVISFFVSTPWLSRMQELSPFFSCATSPDTPGGGGGLSERSLPRFWFFIFLFLFVHTNEPPTSISFLPSGANPFLDEHSCFDGLYFFLLPYGLEVTPLGSFFPYFPSLFLALTIRVAKGISPSWVCVPSSCILKFLLSPIHLREIPGNGLMIPPNSFFTFSENPFLFYFARGLFGGGPNACLREGPPPCPRSP